MVCAKFGKNCSSKKIENVKTFTDGQTDEKETKKTRKKIKNKQTNKNQKKKPKTQKTCYKNGDCCQSLQYLEFYMPVLSLKIFQNEYKCFLISFCFLWYTLLINLIILE